MTNSGLGTKYPPPAPKYHGYMDRSFKCQAPGTTVTSEIMTKSPAPVCHDCMDHSFKYQAPGTIVTSEIMTQSPAPGYHECMDHRTQHMTPKFGDQIDIEQVTEFPPNRILPILKVPKRTTTTIESFHGKTL